MLSILSFPFAHSLADAGEGFLSKLRRIVHATRKIHNIIARDIPGTESPIARRAPGSLSLAGPGREDMRQRFRHDALERDQAMTAA